MSPVPPREPQATRAYVPPLPPSPVAVVGRRVRRRRGPAGPAALILPLLVIVVVSMGRLTEPAPHGRGEIVLQSASAAGAHPFTATVVTGQPARPPAATTGGAAAPAQGDGSARAAITTTRGSQPGLYGGTRGAATCDAQQLVTGLQQRPALAAAWAEVEGIVPGDIPAFAGGLTAVALRGDTRVTDHGFVTDHASSHQSVLETGTGVMVDHFGVARVRCAGGSPLTAPVPVTNSPRYVGTRWTGFTPAGVTVVTAANQPMAGLLLVDGATGARFSRPVGTDGRADGDAPAASAST
ncbi:MAG TPA: DUF6777 domain-containing protein [Candidatus Dormibacteraeota bacterium]|jgi:hypothetical protein|nr:DUF6777 domain-containing protein [Candidatus Dormibacteraeota bacterium]